MEYLKKLKNEIVTKYQKKIGSVSATEEQKNELEEAKKELETKEKSLVEPNRSFLFRLFRRKLYLKQVEDYDKGVADIDAAKKRVSSAGLVIEQKETEVQQLQAKMEEELAIFEGMDLEISKNTSVKHPSLLDNEKYSTSCKKVREYIDEMLRIDPNLVKDAEFMSACVKFDMDLIALDETNSPEVYKAFIEQYSENCLDEARLNRMGYRPEQKEAMRKYCKELLAELTTPKAVAEGKFKIPHKYIFERIKEAKSQEIKGFGVEDICEYAYKDYSELDGKLSKESAEQLISLYEDNDKYFYMHSVNYDGSKSEKEQAEIVEKIETTGLLMPSEGDLAHTTINTKDDKGRGIFHFLQYWAGSSSVVIAQIPKSDIDEKKPILGFHTKDGSDKGRLLPKYIVGSVKGGEFKNNVYLTNEKLKKKVKKFDFFASDGSKPQESAQLTSK